MKLFDRIDNYISEYKYKVIIVDNSVDIVNYKKIIEFTDNVIKVESKDGITTVNGSNLVITKMLSDEILITGKIYSIEL